MSMDRLPRIVRRYVFAVAVVGVAFGIRKLLEPVTGTGAPFVLFFASVVVTSVWAGTGPGVFATLLSIPLGAYVFAMRAGYPGSQAALQASLFAVEGAIVVFLSSRMTRARLAAESSDARQRALIDLAPDAFFLADIDGRFTEVNQVACRMLGYQRDELIGKTIADIIPAEDVPRLAAVRASLVAGRVDRSEWRQRRKDGTLVPVEVSTNILPGGLWQAFVRDISDRKRVEDERQVFVALLDNSSDFIGVADPAGRPMYVNPAGRRMVGLPVDYPVETTAIPDYYPPEQRAFAQDVILKAMVERGRWSGETYFRHWHTEAAIPVSDEHFMIRDPSGQRVLGMGTVTRDISAARQAAREREDLLARERLAREQAEAANAELRESEERFRLTIDEAPIGMALVSLEGRFVRVNAALCEIVGYTADELQQMAYQTITHPDDLDSDVVLAERLVRGEIPRYQLDKRYIRKDGRIVPVLLSASLLRGPQGAPLYGIAQVEDISERKRAEEHQRFLAEAGAVLVASLDLEQTLTALGKLLVRDIADWCIVDIVEGDRGPRRLKVVCAHPEGERAAAQLEQLRIDRGLPHLARPVLQTGEPFLLERVTSEEIASFAQSEEHLQLLRAIGPRSIMGLPLKIHGDLKGVLVLISSTPARAYSSADIRLGDAIAERATLAIENGRLYQTALRATRLRDEVLGVVAHDLRNPLAALTMQATAMRRKGPEPERRDQAPIQRILRAADRMNRLIGDLLDVTLIDAGKLGIEGARVSTRQLVADSVEPQRPLATENAPEIRLELASDLPDVWADQHRLFQVFENLIGNAIKFTPREGRVTVGAAPRDGEVLFWVADTGCGISEEGLRHVFDRFWQAHKRDRRGAGLGLPITRGIIEAHRGRIWVESTLGRGTIFFFTIPDAAHAESHASAAIQ